MSNLVEVLETRMGGVLRVGAIGVNLTFGDGRRFLRLYGISAKGRTS